MGAFQHYEPSLLGIGFGTICIFVVLSILSRKMDVPGALVGGVIGSFLFLGGGFAMLGIMGTFFMLGVAATGWKKEQKLDHGLAQENEGKRSVRHALANGGIAAIYSLMAVFSPHDQLILLAMASGSFASATGDTLSSELGNVYGRKYVNILNLRPDQRGKDGVVSLEGSLLGLLGSLVIACVFGWAYQAWELAVCVGLAGGVGNIMDSVLGATFQQAGHLTNDKVNFLSTWGAACTVLLLTFFFL
ncbi:MAG: DUF92 domain-containing protein [Bacteroidota bacterium]